MCQERDSRFLGKSGLYVDEQALPHAQSSGNHVVLVFQQNFRFAQIHQEEETGECHSVSVMVEVMEGNINLTCQLGYTGIAFSTSPGPSPVIVGRPNNTCEHEYVTGGVKLAQGGGGMEMTNVTYINAFKASWTLLPFMAHEHINVPTFRAPSDPISIHIPAPIIETLVPEVILNLNWPSASHLSELINRSVMTAIVLGHRELMVFATAAAAITRTTYIAQRDIWPRIWHMSVVVDGAELQNHGLNEVTDVIFIRFGKKIKFGLKELFLYQYHKRKKTRCKTSEVKAAIWRVLHESRHVERTGDWPRA
ncbi:hypothetical protein IW261DRAFT_1600635 [Armillaria novae-zelandiae]|uniref:Uncharacterized protein n=1 Tax=Armillaria novae-zelandiae TaxID=153914 RepID=A0AA39KDY0_9AGAR|nr:hypothetical protein IW261DRAFT_1600635 [Armillaria novae-zelandiae]